MAKYKVGDKVKVRSDLKAWEAYDNVIMVPDALYIMGQTLTISDVLEQPDSNNCPCHYYVEENRFIWSEAMFEDDAEKETFKIAAKITPQIDISSLIDEAMEKKDRTVHIFIMGENISVDVRPLEESDPRWIVYPNTHPGYDRRFPYECSECRARSENAFSYCPFCGEKLRMPVIEDIRVEKAPDGPLAVEFIDDDDSPKEGTDE